MMQCLFIYSCNVTDEKKGVNISSCYNTNINLFRTFHHYLSEKTCLEFFLHPNTSIKLKKEKSENFEFLVSLALNERMCHIILYSCLLLNLNRYT